MKTRLLDIANFLKLSIRSFEASCGINRGTISNMTEDSTIGSDKLAKILDSFPFFNAEWILTGRGKMIKDDTDETSPQKGDNFKLTTQKKITQPQGIPLIPVEAMAGYGNGNVQITGYDIQEDYLMSPELAGKGIKYLIRVCGSSMTPQYNNGDLLACRPITDISFLQWGKVYVLDTEQGTLVKRLYPCDPADKEWLECKSDNDERYPPFKIRKESIRKIAIVVAVLRLE